MHHEQKATWRILSTGSAYPITAGDTGAKNFCLGACHLSLKLCQLHLHSGKEGRLFIPRPTFALIDLRACTALPGDCTMTYRSCPEQITRF